MKWKRWISVCTDISVSNNYSESAILKLTKMVLSIFDDYNLNDFYINGDVLIGQGYLAQMKDLAGEIIVDYDDNKE